MTDLTPGMSGRPAVDVRRRPDFGKFPAGPRKESIKCVKSVKSLIFPAGGCERAFQTGLTGLTDLTPGLGASFSLSPPFGASTAQNLTNLTPLTGRGLAAGENCRRASNADEGRARAGGASMIIRGRAVSGVRAACGGARLSQMSLCGALGRWMAEHHEHQQAGMDLLGWVDRWASAGGRMDLGRASAGRQPARG